MAVGPYRHLPRRLEATFAIFWINGTFFKNYEKINIIFKKTALVGHSGLPTGTRVRCASCTNITWAGWLDVVG
jgi:hypothetical protein